MSESKKFARAPLGHTETVLTKMHPDLKAHLERQAEANYCSVAEYVRQLIIADKRAKEAETP